MQGHVQEGLSRLQCEEHSQYFQIGNSDIIQC